MIRKVYTKNKNNLLTKTILIVFLLCFSALNLNATSLFDYPISTIFIDPGHGGVDSGAAVTHDFNPLIEEKDIVLDISLTLEQYLKREMPSLNIILTRSDDTYLTLQERSEVAYKTPLESRTGSLYVSIHANSATNNAHGFEIFTKLKDKTVFLYDEETPLKNISLFSNNDLLTLNKRQYNTSYDLSKNILDNVLKDFPDIKNRGIKSEDFYVLNVCRTTACLVEVGFISNEKEAKKLLDKSYRDSMAKAIGKGIIETIKNRR